MRKAIPGWEGFYEADSNGLIFSVDRKITRINGSVQNWKGKSLRPMRNQHGYLVVRLSKPGQRVVARVHRLIAKTFLDNPLGLPEVNHLDGDRANPSLDNLEWCTASENRRHAYHVLHSITMPKTGKLSIEIANEIRRLHVPGIYGCKRLARRFGVGPSAIRAIITGKAYPPTAQGASA